MPSDELFGRTIRFRRECCSDQTIRIVSGSVCASSAKLFSHLKMPFKSVLSSTSNVRSLEVHSEQVEQTN